jgi:hypothetical protein
MNQLNVIIDQIEDVLEHYVATQQWHDNNLLKALAAARELKEIDNKLEKARENANKIWEQATGEQI